MGGKRETFRTLLQRLVLPAGVILALALFAGAVNSLSVGRRVEGLNQLKQALRRGCVACYAAEGRYPPDLEYLKEHYGVQIDGERYHVVYDIFAPNLMPDITVLEFQP